MSGVNSRERKKFIQYDGHNRKAGASKRKHSLSNRRSRRIANYRYREQMRMRTEYVYSE